MSDTRSHLFYLIAMFLMLAIGILIGESYYGGAQVKQQTKALAGLRQQIAGAVQQGRMAQDELTKTNIALDTLRLRLAHRKLGGRHVILVQTGDYADATDDANTAISDAGGLVVATVILTDKWQILPDTDQNTSASSLAMLLTAGTETNAANEQARQSLEEQGLVTISGDLSVPCQSFVLIGGGKGTTDDSGDDSVMTGVADTALLSALQAIGHVTIVGCEPFDTAQSFIPIYQKAGIPTVDCIDRPLGKLDLAFALRGEAGDYGLKSTAQQTFPASEQEIQSP